MAERRMFSKTIIDSDSFLDMPLSSQALYFHLSMRADDDGFINNPKKIQRMVGAADDDAKLLLTKKFIISFESGIIVIKHWKLHNYIQKDRYKPTIHTEEKGLLETKSNKEYSMDTECIQDGHSGKVRLGKVRLGKDREEKKRKRFSPPTLEQAISHCGNKEEAEKFILYYESNGWMVGKNKMKNWRSALTGWIKRSKQYKSDNDPTGKERQRRFREKKNKDKQQHFDHENESNALRNGRDNATVTPPDTDTDTDTDTDDDGFEEFWDLYDKKIDRRNSKKKWSRLSKKDRKDIMKALPAYLSSQSDKKYRKNPMTYLNHRSWEDEVIVSKEDHKHGSSPSNVDNYQIPSGIKLLNPGALNDH